MKYSLSPQEIHQTSPSGFSSGSGKDKGGEEWFGNFRFFLTRGIGVVYYIWILLTKSESKCRIRNTEYDMF